MSWRVRWTDNALQAIEEILDFQGTRGSSQATELVTRLFDRVDKLAGFPFSAPAYTRVNDQRIRRLVYDKYVILYRLLESEQEIQILTVRHQRQRPLDIHEIQRD